ncbi:MAG: c-type cytochrome biogenesis protein CcsB, partial [Actinobacteria bacterium]|nr:c-type cytochrome biogenesis protein CcsB [Actinomycetota bacterium]
MLETLEHYSTLSLYSAMAVYAIAFVFFAVDLANRSGGVAPAQAAAPAATAGAASGSTLTITRAQAPAAAQTSRAPRSRSLRIGFALTVVAFVFHAAATILRGIAAERVPFANMYEFSLTATLSIVAVYLLVQFFVDLRFLGVLITGLALLFLGVTKVNYYVDIVPLPPALDSYWLVLHIMV